MKPDETSYLNYCDHTEFVINVLMKVIDLIKKEAIEEMPEIFNNEKDFLALCYLTGHTLKENMLKFLEEKGVESIAVFNLSKEK